MSKENLIQAHNWFYEDRGFEWISDKDRLGKYEYWQILTCTEGSFKGDCEDAALTIMNKMLELGSNPDKIFIVRCRSEKAKPWQVFDHAVLGYVSEGKWYFSDNRYQNYPACALRSLDGFSYF